MSDSSKLKQKFADKLIDQPAVPIGLVGLVATAVYGIKNYKKSGGNATAYFGSLRVIAQSMVVGALGIVVVSEFVKKHLLTPPSEDK